MSNTPNPAPKRPKGRALTDFKNLSWAEKKLIACAARGTVCKLGDNVPDKPTRFNAIRPELIRFLALGGDENTPVHEKGLIIEGACIGVVSPLYAERALNFDGARLATNLSLINCDFQMPLIFREAQAKSLRLDGSLLRAINADRLKLDRDFSLQMIRAEGIVSLVDATIGGNLVCNNSNFQGSELALYCNGANIAGNVFLSDAFHAFVR